MNLHWLLDILQKNAIASGGLLVLATGAVMAQLRAFPSKIWRLVRERFILTVEVPDSDAAYTWLERWWAAQDAGKRTRTLMLITDTEDDEEDRHGKTQVILAPGPGEHFMLYHRTPIWLSKTRQKLEMSRSGAPFFQTLQLRMFAGKRATIQQLIHEAKDCYDNKSRGLTKVHVPMYESWTVATMKSARSLESLVFDGDLSQQLIADLRRFQDRKEWYAEMGIPHRRGYLLHGPPGTGKSSLCLAAAAYLKMDVALLSLGASSMTDDYLAKLFHQPPTNSVLVLEDIDAIFEGREKKADNKLTFSGLLNVLDGVASSEGRVVFMTSNHPGKLDPALIRHGRCDRHFEVGYTTTEQARQYFLRFWPEQHDAADVFSKLLPESASMAQLQEHLLQTQESLTAAVAPSWSSR